jgi:LmbE family N-acetylglucosaminyl deacetylase
MTKIFLSPHLDDAVFSCGGMIFEEIKKGERVEVWTFATADPPQIGLTPFARSLHERWGNPTHPVRVRREEDHKALSSLGCGWKHLGFLDCIYRFDEVTSEPLICRDEDLFAPLNGREEAIIERITQATQTILANFLPGVIDVFTPLAVGGHIDHQITRVVAERLELEIHYYADFPDAAKYPAAIETSLPQGVVASQTVISARGLIAWQEAIACYRSQISSFWNSSKEMKQAVETYAGFPAARTIWKQS